jgi:hypothetical protein
LVQRRLSVVALGSALSAVATMLPGATGGAVELGWREFTPSGVPVGAGFAAVAAGAGGFVAAGNDLGSGDQSDFVLWHSADGEAWSEVHRIQGKVAINADVVPAGGGFAVIGTTCIVPNSEGPPQEQCEPMAVVSGDGMGWERAALEIGGADWRGTSALVASLAGAEGRLIAGGWIERAPGERDPAVWHSEDGGKRWALSATPVPANPEKPDEIEAIGRVPGGWLATGYDELERRGGPSLYIVNQESRMWSSADGQVWERVQPPNGSSSVDLLTASRDAGYVSGGSAGGVSVWRRGPDGAWFSTDDGFQAVPNSMSVLEGDDDGLVLGGLEPQGDRNRTVLWGSADGFKYRRTLTAPERTWFTTAVRHKDRWYVYGTTSPAVGISSMHGWVASVGCATGETCSDVGL